ncbi:MAG: hypothetical protein A3F75_06285 [Betaproteobacteria bacterium RIFCSPLOWO2_12_FULL_64_23]|nr:MAG: hypothetical protein A3F75_06285 [Betaproteobacteria bacterium RIFCSPLOWO2_12_FULL_64_23]
MINKRTPKALAERTAASGRDSHATAVCSYIEGEIIAGRMEPGDSLDEAELARRFRVSRTPVREALLQLAAIDWIQFRPRRGAVVAPITLQRMVQMFEVMAELEAMCARLAAERMTAAERNLLQQAARACAREARSKTESATSRYFDANYAFHEIVYIGAHNDHLLELVKALRNRLTPYRRFRLRNPMRLKNSSREHDSVAKAIVDGDGERAAQEMRSHIAIQSALLADMASQLPSSYLALVK